MELTNIENLLEKYENAETSLQEEALLKDYFSQENVATHLLEYKPLFVYFTKSGEERFTKTIPLKKEKAKMRREKKRVGMKKKVWAGSGGQSDSVSCS